MLDDLYTPAALSTAMELVTALSVEDPDDAYDTAVDLLGRWHDDDVCLQDVTVALASMLASSLDRNAELAGIDPVAYRRQFALDVHEVASTDPR